jgi:hypothetical protein
MTQTVILRGDAQRDLAKRLIDKAPQDAIVKISAAKRTDDQNAKMWAMLSDISRAAPEDRHHIPEVWKCIFMAALAHEVIFTIGLNNQPFPIGFKTSKLTKAQMSDMIEFIYAYGSQHNVKWSEKCHL